MLEKTEAESAAHKHSVGHPDAVAHAVPAAQDCVTVKCLTEQLDKKTDADQAKLFAKALHPPLHLLACCPRVATQPLPHLLLPNFPLQMREDAIREHLSPPPAHVASNLHLAASAAQSESATAQSPAEAAAAHIIKTAADAAKAMPVINAAIQQNERECGPYTSFPNVAASDPAPLCFS
jgi:hypothetical protein